MEEMKMNPIKNEVHVWEKVEITLEAQNTYCNPYTEVEVWLDLKGPDFNKRVFGFWDGGNTFRVRIAPTGAGEWTWISGSNKEDVSLNGQSGSLTAIEWSEKEKDENNCRRGFVKATAAGHAMEYADGTPFFIIGDTWLAGATARHKWYEDDTDRPLGPEAGFKDHVKYRKAQGYNSVVMIASLPQWFNDGKPNRIFLEDGETVVRDSWVHPDTRSGKDMFNEGGNAFMFPGRVPGNEDVFPDVDRINPEYFKYLDKRMDYLNEMGFVPFLETARRDVSHCWKKFYDWPNSYVRYIQYIFSRYGANNCILSPIHFDWWFASVDVEEYNVCANMVLEKYGYPPFGNLVSANCNPSTVVNFEQKAPQKWLTLHMIGNKREHEHYWYLTDIYNSNPPRPAFNGEPYYAGYYNLGELYEYGAVGGTETDDLYCRSGMYGGFLSGALGGHMYGAEGIWGADVEEGSRYKMWDAFTWNSAAELRHLNTFAMTYGKRYQELIPNSEVVIPNKTGETKSFTGWSFCAHTKERDLFLLFFEKEAPEKLEVRKLIRNSTYEVKYFDPRKGEWFKAAPETITTDEMGRADLERFGNDLDWGMSLELRG
jgi:hypothetical protein